VEAGLHTHHRITMGSNKIDRSYMLIAYTAAARGCQKAADGAMVPGGPGTI